MESGHKVNLKDIVYYWAYGEEKNKSSEGRKAREVSYFRKEREERNQRMHITDGLEMCVDE